MGRIKKAVETVTKKGVKPLVQGKKNFNNPTDEVEALAKERLEICKGCVFFEEEPIEWLKVEDERLPEASGMYCADCGCVSSYKIRQSLQLCEKWQEIE